VIQIIPHAISEGLRKENEIHHQHKGGHTREQLQAEYPTMEEFLKRFLNRAEGWQFVRAVAELKPGARVLDIGAGTGRTSVYLASQGHRVAALEPSPDLCRFIADAAQLYGLSLDIYNATAETIDRLPVRDFDACIFNASFHHCDEPERALAGCHQVLVRGGRVLLLNEPLLQLFRSKAWFQRQLAEGALVTGDYGGNEHTYYHHEYIAMLKAARFGEIRDYLSLRYLNPERYLHRIERRRAPLREVRSRRLYYRAIHLLARSGPLGRPALALLKRLSLVQTYFVATKLSA
jgi:SAM-dependent methyltransferase